MIRTDGDRSLKRLWFAKKKLAQIQEMNLPSKRVVYDGFDIKVWQMDELSGGSIKAPMGAVVARVDGQHGLQVAVADYWGGAFSPGRDYHGLMKDYEYFAVIPRATEEEIAALSFESIPLYPLQVFAHYANNVIYLFPTPGIMPYYGEAYDVTHRGIVTINSAPEGEPEVYDLFKEMYERSRSFYIQDNTVLQRLATAIYQTDTYDIWPFGVIAPHYDVYSLCQQLTPEKQALSMAYRFLNHNGIKAAAFVINIPEKYNPEDPLTEPSGTVISLSSMIQAETMPVALKSIMTDVSNDTAFPIATYSFNNSGANGLLVVVNASDYDHHRQNVPSGDLTDYFNSNSPQFSWRFFFSISDGTNVYTHNMSQFGSLLETLSGEDPAITDLPITEPENTKLLLAVLQRACSVWPNQHPDSPYDSAMFHTHTGDVYSWSRLYGMLKFSAAGLSRESSVIVPDVIGINTGCRPEIYYSGTYNEVPFYICFANKVNVNILGVYVGSPFTNWFALPYLPDEFSLIHCRPCVVRPDRIFLVGVAKASTELFFTSISITVPEDETLETMVMPSWNIQGKLPFSIDEYNLNCYQVGLFGEGQMVEEMKNFVSQQPILSQMPWTPNYSIYNTLWDFVIS